MPGTLSDAPSSSHPRTPVPMEAKRTVSLGATGLGEAHNGFGCRRVNFAAAPTAVAAVPTRRKSRRVHAGCFMTASYDLLRVSIQQNRCGGIIAYESDPRLAIQEQTSAIQQTLRVAGILARDSLLLQ